MTKSRTMTDYADRLHAENERLRAANNLLLREIREHHENCNDVAMSAVTHESAMRWWRCRSRKYSLENAELRARLAAVRERCESKNWMGTARMRDG